MGVATLILDSSSWASPRRLERAERLAAMPPLREYFARVSHTAPLVAVLLARESHSADCRLHPLCHSWLIGNSGDLRECLHKDRQGIFHCDFSPASSSSPASPPSSERMSSATRSFTGFSFSKNSSGGTSFSTASPL